MVNKLVSSHQALLYEGLTAALTAVADEVACETRAYMTAGALQPLSKMIGSADGDVHTHTQAVTIQQPADAPHTAPLPATSANTCTSLSGPGLNASSPPPQQPQQPPLKANMQQAQSAVAAGGGGGGGAAQTLRVSSSSYASGSSYAFADLVADMIRRGDKHARGLTMPHHAAGGGGMQAQAQACRHHSAVGGVDDASHAAYLQSMQTAGMAAELDVQVRCARSM